jgi:hypothetical protein
MFVKMVYWYINITFTILDIIHRPVSHLKHNVSETRFCLLNLLRWAMRLSVSGPGTEIDFIYWTHLSRFHLNETEFSLQNVVFYIKDKMM